MSDEDGTTPAGAPGDGPRVLDALREGWHALGGGDAAGCPGCPVCRLTTSAGRLDPATAEHLQQAVGHVVAAGRELLAALGSAEAGPGPGRRRAAGPADPGADRLADPPTTAGRPRRTIPVRTAGETPETHPPTRPDQGNEEQE